MQGVRGGGKPQAGSMEASADCPLCCTELDVTDRAIQYCECGCERRRCWRLRRLLGIHMLAAVAAMQASSTLACMLQRPGLTTHAMASPPRNCR